MRLSVLAVTAGFAASSVAHPLMGHEHEYEHKHKHGMTPKVLGGIIDEEIIVVPTKEDMITPQTYKHHHHKEEHHHNKHGGGSGPIIVKAADGSLEYLSTESESNHHKRPKHHGSGGNTPTILVENSDGSVSVVEVETEPENHHHKHHGGYQKEHEKHHHQHHGGGSSSLEEVDGVVYETEPENHHHKHHGGYQKEHEKHHHKHHGGGSGSTPSSSHGVESSGKAGRIPGNPLYVDIGTSLATEPPLFPDNTFLTRREIEVFRDLTTGIVEGQKAMMECVPVTVPSCEVSLKHWHKLSEMVDDYKVLRQAHYIEACNSLRNSLESLNGVDTKQDPKLKAILWKMLLDNLLLAGYLDEVYEGTIIPNYTLDPPGEVIGALIHFIGIDVTKALNFWPVFTPYLYQDSR